MKAPHQLFYTQQPCLYPTNLLFNNPNLNSFNNNNSIGDNDYLYENYVKNYMPNNRFLEDNNQGMMQQKMQNELNEVTEVLQMKKCREKKEKAPKESKRKTETKTRKPREKKVKNIEDDKETIEDKKKYQLNRKAENAKKWRDRRKEYISELENEVKQLRRKKEELEGPNKGNRILQQFLIKTLPDQMTHLNRELYANNSISNGTLLNQITNYENNLGQGDQILIKLYLEQVKDLLIGYEDLLKMNNGFNAFSNH